MAGEIELADDFDTLPGDMAVTLGAADPRENPQCIYDTMYSMYEIDFADEAEAWLLGLEDDEFAAIAAAIDLLEQTGPTLGRPAVDSIRGSRHRNMKELRSFGGHLRALFAFDPRRRAIILVGGDKRNDWRGWYERNIPIADDRYDKHLKKVRRRSK